MTDLENALRDALDAQATMVQPDPLAYDRLVRRRTSRRLGRWAAVATAAAAAAVAGVVVLRPGGGEPVDPAGSVGPAPEQVAAIVDDALRLYDGFAFRDSSATQLEGYKVTALATAGTRHYFFASVAADPEQPCESRLNRYDVSGTETHSKSVLREEAAIPGSDVVVGKVEAMAVTRDETRLAYLVRLPREWGACGTHGELHVRDLRTGAERVWRPHSDLLAIEPVSSLSWSPDGRHLSLGAGFEVLDTAAPATTYGRGSGRVNVDGHLCDTRDQTFHPVTGTLVSWVRCLYNNYALTGVYEHGADGKATRRLFLAPSPLLDVRPRLVFDASGDHLLMTVPDGGIVRALRWNARDGLHEVAPLPSYRTTQLSW